MELKTRTKKITVKSLQLSYKKGALSNNRAVNQQQYILMVDLPKVRYLKATSTQGPHSHILMMGGPTEVHILYPKKSQLQNYFVYPKSPYFFQHTQKNPSVFLHQQILLFTFWKAKTCQLQLWFWSKTKLYKNKYKKCACLLQCLFILSSATTLQKIFIMTSTACLVLSTFLA